MQDPPFLPLALLAAGSLGLLVTADRAMAQSAGTAAESPPHLLLHEDLVRAWKAPDTIDLENLRSVFWHVFSRLPPEVRVYSSENYYYWQLDVAGRHLQGNMRLPARERDRGFVGFAYSEAERLGDRGGKRTRIQERKMMGPEDAISVNKVSRGIYDVGYSDHFVRFHLEDLSQDAPGADRLREGEKFIGRTLDESGLQFLLVFETRGKYFFWLLDDSNSATVDEHFVEFEPNVIIGRRTGFVFKWDQKAANRKVLIAVRQSSAESNDYYDGPFDQLPDNHVDKTRIRDWMVLENPALEGRIDRYGYYLNEDPPVRVALARYADYTGEASLKKLLEKGASAADWRAYFAQWRSRRSQLSRSQDVPAQPRAER